MSIMYNSSFVTDNLVTCIDFANSKSSPKTGTSPVIIYDLSGNGINWTTQNGCTINLNNIALDGNTGYLLSGTSLAGYAPAWSPSSNSNNNVGNSFMTFELVFSSSDNGYIISRPWNGGGGYNYSMTPTQFAVSVLGTTATINHSNICTGNIVHMTWWMNSTQYGIYMNGVPFVAATNHGLTGFGGGAAGTSDFGCVLGSLYPYGQGWAGNTGFSVSGNYYLLRIYKKQLTPDEILQNFMATRGRFGL